MELLPISPYGVGPVTGGTGTPASGPAAGPGFKEMLGDYLKQVNEMQQDADKAVVDLATGRLDNLHEVVAAVSEADLSFRLMMQVRNKLVDAYNEIMRLQV